jgi:hypothetical protein
VVRPPYPVAVRLCSLTAERWAELDTAYRDLPRGLIREKPHRLANFVYSWCIERVEPDKLDDWIVMLNDLLPWQDPETSEAAVNLESESFFQMQGKGG